MDTQTALPTAHDWLLNDQQGSPTEEVLGPWRVVVLGLGGLSSLGPGAASEESVLSLSPPPTPAPAPMTLPAHTLQPATEAPTTCCPG